MRNIAIGLLIVVLLSFVIEPLVEVLNVTREKIILGSALTNASRAAKDRSIIYESHREIDAEIEEERFIKYFSIAFADAMNLNAEPRNGNVLKFTSIDGKYNSFTVTLDFIEEVNAFTGQIVSEVKVKAESAYKFKTKYLRIAEDAGGDVAYKLIGERSLLLSVKN